MGLNEFAGYLAVALASLISGYVAATWGLRPYPFYLGIAFALAGLAISVFFIRDTGAHAALETHTTLLVGRTPSVREVFLRTSFTDRNLSAVSQAGLVNNLNDGMAWGLFPLLFSSAGLSIDRIGWLVALYPASWGIAQLAFGPLSDQMGRKWLIAVGMWVQAGAIFWIAVSHELTGFSAASLLLGFGTAMVYPTLLAAIGDVAHSSWRASAVGVYRFWRDGGYAVGGLISGIAADLFGLRAAVGVVAALTFISGTLVAVRMRGP
jgi:MFS family permease